MPLILDPGDGGAIGLDAFVEVLSETSFDARDEESFAALGPLLARLGRNRGFLGDLAVRELESRCAGQSAMAGYGPQVFLLRPPDGRVVLRANFWPGRDDALAQASGEAAFAYGMAHDHPFSFLTYGHFGPGYWSDYYEPEAAGPAPYIGLAGEDARLRFVGRDRLEPGRLMLYRRGRDVHCQLPPDRFSVSLNILASDPAMPWRDQYRFDLARGTIAEALTTTSAEVALMLAVHFHDDGPGLARHFARTHPVARMRVAALDALADAAPGDADVRRMFERAADAADARVAGHARMRLRGFSGPGDR